MFTNLAICITRSVRGASTSTFGGAGTHPAPAVVAAAAPPSVLRPPPRADGRGRRLPGGTNGAAATLVPGGAEPCVPSLLSPILHSVTSYRQPCKRQLSSTSKTNNRSSTRSPWPQCGLCQSVRGSARKFGRTDPKPGRCRGRAVQVRSQGVCQICFWCARGKNAVWWRWPTIA